MIEGKKENELRLRQQDRKTNVKAKGSASDTFNRIVMYGLCGSLMSNNMSLTTSPDLSNPDGLVFKSITETSVEVQWQPFYYSFDGWEISFIPKVE